MDCCAHLKTSQFSFRTENYEEHAAFDACLMHAAASPSVSICSPLSHKVYFDWTVKCKSPKVSLGG